MSCEPSFDYHRNNATWEYSAQAYGEAIARAHNDPDSHPTLRITTNLRIGLEGREARGERHELRSGVDRGRRRIAATELSSLVASPASDGSGGGDGARRHLAGCA